MKPCVAFVGASGVGKTTQLLRLIEELRGRGLRVGLLKHTHHALENDKPGSDTQRHQGAGAQPVALLGPNGLRVSGPIPVELAVAWLSQTDVDVILVEGGKNAALPRIEVTRGFEQLLVPPDQLIATLGDVEVAGVPRLLPDQPAQWADFLISLWFPA